MRVKILSIVLLLNALGSCLPQGLGDPIRTTITIGGFTFTETINIPTDTQTRVTSIDTGPGRSTSIGGGTTTSAKGTTTSTKSSSKTIVTISTTALPPTTSPTPSTKPTTSSSSSSSTSSIIKSLPPTTTSISTSSTPTTTSPQVITSTSSIIKTLPPTTTATPTNPWSPDCPVPSNFAVSNFVSVDGPGGGVSLKLSYGNGTFTCPNVPSNQVTYDGLYDLDCSDDGITRVITDGFSWIWIQEWYWCPSVPQPQGSFATLQTLTNFTNFASDLNCNTNDVGVQTCFQIPPSLSIPVDSYGVGGIIGFSPLDVNGNPLSQCTSLYMTNPIVTDTSQCTPGATPTTTPGKVTITIATTQTATVTVT